MKYLIIILFPFVTFGQKRTTKKTDTGAPSYACQTCDSIWREDLKVYSLDTNHLPQSKFDTSLANLRLVRLDTGTKFTWGQPTILNRFLMIRDKGLMIERLDSMSPQFAKDNNLEMGCQYVFVFGDNDTEFLRINLKDNSMIISDTTMLIRQLLDYIFAETKRSSKMYKEIDDAKYILKKMFVQRYITHEMIKNW